MYQPDRWAIVAVSSDETIYKVFAGWFGGFLDEDSWRLNSGIVEVSLDGNAYLFTGHSGTVYRCHKNTYGLTSYMAAVWEGMLKLKASDLELSILPEDTDFVALLTSS